MSRVRDARLAVAGVVDGLELGGTEVVVDDHPSTPEQLMAPRVVIAAATVRPPDVACPGVQVELAVWCVAELQDPADGQDRADALLDAVLERLDAARLEWTTAERGVWAETYPAYRVTVTV